MVFVRYTHPYYWSYAMSEQKTDEAARDPLGEEMASLDQRAKSLTLTMIALIITMPALTVLVWCLVTAISPILAIVVAIEGIILVWIWLRLDGNIKEDRREVRKYHKQRAVSGSETEPAEKPAGRPNQPPPGPR